MPDPVFLDLEDLIYIHKREIERSGGSSELRDPSALEAAVAAPQVTRSGRFLMDLFDMAASYVVSIVYRHPFLDGNKRCGTAVALTFLYINGYEVTEELEEELADQVLDLISGKIDREDLGRYFREHSTDRVS